MLGVHKFPAPLQGFRYKALILLVNIGVGAVLLVSAISFMESVYSDAQPTFSSILETGSYLTAHTTKLFKDLRAI